MAMHRLRLSDAKTGLRLARPARSVHGDVILAAGVLLQTAQLQHLEQMGIEEIVVVPAGEAIPEPTVPAYMDRYEPNFASQLQGVFKDTLQTRTMQELFLRSLDHASHCYRSYRLDEDAGKGTVPSTAQGNAP